MKMTCLASTASGRVLLSLYRDIEALAGRAEGLPGEPQREVAGLLLRARREWTEAATAMEQRRPAVVHIDAVERLLRQAEHRVAR